MLRENKTLRSLNLESNFITGAGVQGLVDALRDNDTLTEIKIDNQVATAPLPTESGCHMFVSGPVTGSAAAGSSFMLMLAC